MSPPVRRTRLIFRARRVAWSAITIVLALAAAPVQGRAETVITTQDVRDNGVFLPDDPRPAQPAGLCLVDTGVDLNPDTEGVVIDRVAIDGGSGNDVSPTLHGTVMAMMAGAPANGWGMVGTAPRSIQIVSVRILEPGQTAFPFAYYTDGITTCLKLQQEYDIKVIDLSLGSSNTPSSQDSEAITNALQEANNYGVAVVAAAGNDDGGPLDYPAAYPSVLSVAASNTESGAFCSFTNRGEGLRLIAPGCDLDGANPITGEPNENYLQGSSEASVIASAALDALDSYQPGLSPQASEEYLTAADGGTLDIAQSFRNASLGHLVAEGEAAEPTTQTSSAPVPPQSVPPSESMNLIAPFTRPQAQLKRVKRHLVLILTDRPSKARTQVRYLGYRDHSRHLSVLRTLSGLFENLTIPSTGVIEVSVRYTDPYDIERASPWTTLKILPASSRTAKARRAR